MNRQQSEISFLRAKEVIPGGVNSPVRAFKSVGGNPIFMKSAKGQFLFDNDGNKYLDMINSWGPMILGHNHEYVVESVTKALKDGTSFGTPGDREVEIAEMIVKMVPSIEKVRMVNSGTEATMSAIRLARGFTGKDKFIKFEGCYHGHGDSFLIAAGSGAMTMGTPDSPGVTEGTAKDTLLADFNNLQSVSSLVEAHRGELAAIILEPVGGNMGCVPPGKGFLEGVREICNKEGILLIFDEVMTGFRLAPGGAQEYFGVHADITTLGKVIGGGMPVGAYGGSKEIMDFVSPMGPVYQAGTLSGNPVAMACGLATLEVIDQNKKFHDDLNSTSKVIVDGYRSIISKLGLDYKINQVGSMYSLFFNNEEVVDFESAKKCDTGLFGSYFREMLNRGIYLAPSQFETLFVSSILKEEDIELLLNSNEAVLKELNS